MLCDTHMPESVVSESGLFIHQLKGVLVCEGELQKLKVRKSINGRSILEI